MGELLVSETPLSAPELVEAQTILSTIRSVTPDRIDRLIQLVLVWIGLNPQPKPNTFPSVGR
ncbi:MAG: hypothetical protein ACRDAX_01480 [Propionibacteriaceae bacterium]